MDLLILNINPSENLESDINTTRPAAVDIQLKIFGVFMPLIGTLIIAVNLAIVISSGLILHRGQQPRSTYILLGNIALSDMFTGLAILYSFLYPKESRKELTCSTQMGMVVSSALTSAYGISLIAIDRYLYILHGLRYQRYVNPTRTYLMILIMWTFCLCVGFLPAMGLRNDTNDGKLCWFVILTPPNVILFTMIFGIIPLIVIIVLYGIILKHALMKVSQLKKAGNTEDGGARSGNLRLFRGGGSNLSRSRDILNANNEDLNRESRINTNTNNNNKRELENSQTPLQRNREIEEEEEEDQEEINNREESRNQNEPLRKHKRRENKNSSSVFSRCWKACIYHRNNNGDKENKRSNISSVYNPSKWKAIKVVIFTTGSFFITWFPFFIASIMFSVCNPENTPIYCDKLRVAITSPLTILALINSLLNPLIYAWWHNGFRESIKKMYHNILGRKSDRNSSLMENFTRNRITTDSSRTTSTNQTNLSSNNSANVNDCTRNVGELPVSIGTDRNKMSTKNEQTQQEEYHNNQLILNDVVEITRL